MSTIGNGNKGRFSERLKKMRRDRLRKKYILDITDINETDKIENKEGQLKRFFLIPIMLFSKRMDFNRTVKFEEEQKDIEISNENSSNYLQSKKLKVVTIKNINVSLIKKRQDALVKRKREVVNSIGNYSYSYSNKETSPELLEKEIINLIKKRLIKNINELEILQSELYVLNEIETDEVYLAKCQDNIKELKKLIDRIKKLKEKYDYLKDNFDFEYLLSLDDNLLEDKIIEYKKMCESDGVISLVKNYKLLEEYKYLYLKIDKIKESADELEIKKKEKIEELKARDIDFEKFKDKVINVNRIKEKYDSFIRDQQELVNELNAKISDIDSYEEVHYRLKGFNRLLFNCFKFFGLALLTPFNGLIPSIATQSLLTKAEIANLRRNLNWEEEQKTVYTAVDYSSTLNYALNNLDDTDKLVDSTLDDVIKLKKEFNDKFKKYSSDFSEYDEVIGKINKVENAIIGNKVKLNIVRERMKTQKRENEKKLVRVKSLNN